MFVAIIRVLFGFVVAALVAGTIQVGFAVGPEALLRGLSEGDRTAEWVLLTATHAAVFAAPFALIAASVGEWQSLRSPIFYVLAGGAVAAAGFMAQHQSEIPGQPSIVNTYAAVTYGVTGALAGFAYWLSAGRWAGDQGTPESTPAKPVDAAVATAGAKKA